MTIKLQVVNLHNQRYKDVGVEFSSFSSGERHVKVDVQGLVLATNEIGVESSEQVTLLYTANLWSSDDLMDLLLLKDALGVETNHKVSHLLHLGYIPYDRQDRVCNEGEALSLRVFCNILNTANFDEVSLDYPHSDVSFALINNSQLMNFINVLGRDLPEGCKLVSPDAGAEKRLTKIAKATGRELIACTKVRDPLTGDILSNSIPQASVEKNNDGVRYSDVCVIIDDICDGGRTFMGLAKDLKALGAKEVHLRVAHAILPYGTDELLKSIDSISAVNVHPNQQDNPNIKRINL